jgi:hypothetical protein
MIGRLLIVALAACSAPAAHVCADGASQQLACGLNRRGLQDQHCEDGAWSALGPCDDPDACVDATDDALPCGRNGRGAAPRTCVAGAWDVPDTCSDPDICVDGGSTAMACGPNGRGSLTQRCVAGTWTTSACGDRDVCTDGSEDHLPCGELGAQSRVCSAGQWGEYAACVAPLIIHAPGRRDMVHDAKRHRLYITTHGHTGDGEVLSYDLVAHQFDPPLLTGGAFVGIDLSPDGDQLVVADSLTDASHSWIYLIELTTRAAHKVQFPLGLPESGAFSVVFSTNHQVLVVFKRPYSDDVGLCQVDVDDPATCAAPLGVLPGEMLSRSADGTAVVIAAMMSPGEVGRYDVAAGTGTTHELGPPAYDLAVDRTGGQLAVTTSEGLYVLDRAYNQLAVLGAPHRVLPVGAAYSPVSDELYLAWGGATTSLDVYSATTLRKLRDIAPLPGLFFWPIDNGAPTTFNNGRLKLSRDGTLIFATAPPATVLVYSTGVPSGQTSGLASIARRNSSLISRASDVTGSTRVVPVR